MSIYKGLDKIAGNYGFPTLAAVCNDDVNAATCNINLVNVNLVEGLAITVMFTKGHYGSNFKLSINKGTAILIYVAKNGYLVEMPSTSIDYDKTGVKNWYCQPYTSLTLQLVDKKLVVVNNPVVISINDYEIFADGTSVYNKQAIYSKTEIETNYYNKKSVDSDFVPQTRKINNKALSSNITLSAGDVSAYTKTETNNKFLEKQWSLIDATKPIPTNFNEIAISVFYIESNIEYVYSIRLANEQISRDKTSVINVGGYYYGPTDYGLCNLNNNRGLITVRNCIYGGEQKQSTLYIRAR